MTARPRGFLIIVIGFEAGVGLFALVLGALLDVPPLERIDFTPSAMLIGVAATLPTLGFLVWLHGTTAAPIRRLLDTIDRTITPLFAGTSAGPVLVISLLAGFGEEALFRGVLFDLTAPRWGPVAGLIVTSLLFGLAHLVTATYAILATVMGLYLGVLALWSDNLAVPIIVHAVYDVAALSYLVQRSPAKGETNRSSA